jgi:dCMP deaminase
MRPGVDELYLDIASLIATRSTCPRRQVGCVLVDNKNRILSTGYNGVASGRVHCIDHPCPGATYASGQGLDKCEALHAEQNAILLLHDPWAVETAYLTVTPCLSCLKLLLGTSCQRIVAREEYKHPEAVKWWVEAGRDWIILPKG